MSKREPNVLKRVTFAAGAALLMAAFSAGAALADPDVPGGAEQSSASTTVAVPQPGWLLPWPGSIDAELPDNGLSTGGGAADAAPTDDTSASQDAALTAFRQAQNARAAWQAAERLLPAAQSRARNAVATSDTLTKIAADRRSEADAAHEKVSALARAAYMNGTPPQVDALLGGPDQLSGSPAIGAGEVAGVLSYQIGTAKDADVSAVEAAAQASAAVSISQTATSEVTRLETLIADQKDLEQRALRVYQAYLAVTSAQTSVGVDGCPKEEVAGTLRDGAEALGVVRLCRDSVRNAATPQAALAVLYAFSKLGAPYACDGVGRMGDFRFDCSSLASRSYAETSGIPFPADSTWAHSTRDMIPWDGVSLDPHYVEVSPSLIRPGDLLLWQSCTQGPCAYQHVTIALADGYMLHTNSCGDVAHVSKNPGYGPGSSFIIARRVTFLPGEENLVKAMLRNPWVPDNMSGRNFDDTAVFLDPSTLLVGSPTDVSKFFSPSGDTPSGSGPAPKPSPTPTATPSPKPSPSPTVSPSPTRSPKPSPSPTVTPSPTPSAFDPSPTPSPSGSGSAGNG